MSSAAVTTVDEAKADTPATIVLKEHAGDDESKVNSRFGVVCTTTEPLAVPMSMYADNRARVLAKLKAAGDVPANSVILVQGGETPTFFDTDHEPVFKQEGNFHYLFGVKEPDFFGVVHVDTGKAVLYCPRLPAEYATWMGDILTPAQFKEMYQVDEVLYSDELLPSLTAASPGALLRLHGVNTDSGSSATPATFEGIESFEAPLDSRLFTAIVEARVIKSAQEIEVMRYMNRVSSEAHLAVIRNCKPGLKEYQMEAIFQHWCYYHGGSRCMSYTCICAAGNNGATLHYGHAGAPNDKTIAEGDMCLFDMGGEYCRYGSDITCSFPANGKFTEDQKMVYQAVLDATWAVEQAMKPGVSWPDMHGLAYRVVLERLTAAGVLVGEVDEMMEANLGSIFMPHGLGHFLGIDTHDVGGYPEGVKRDSRPGWSSLRCGRTLEAGMIITVEPGIYFNDYNISKALANPEQAKFLNTEALARFKGFGGVRIEDDVLVCETHAEVMTHVPRTVEDIEAVMAGTINRREELYKPNFAPGGDRAAAN